MEVLELEDYQYNLPPYVRFPSFTARKLNLKYIKEEFKWYLRGDRYDHSIMEHASMWASLVDADNGINSNYGQYVFNTDKGIHYVLAELLKDRDSRRASLMILSNERLSLDSKDTPCTYSMNWRIRENKLNMSVVMRSQDLVWGMGNDAPCFSFIHEILFVLLKEHYPELEMGRYNHTSNSAHTYERHYKMMDAMIQDDAEFISVDCPRISGGDEARFLMNMHKEEYVFKLIPEEYKFTLWLLDSK